MLSKSHTNYFASTINTALFDQGLPLFFCFLRDKVRGFPWNGKSPQNPLTIRGAAAGPVTGTVPHFYPLPSYFQQIWIWQASFTGIAKPLLIVASVIRDVDGCPGGPWCGLLQLWACIGVTRLVFLEVKIHSMFYSYST